MRTLMTGSAVAALVGTALTVMSVLPASAQLARPQTAASISGDNTLLTDVQWRRGGGWRGGYGWRGGGYGYRGYGYRPWVGAGVGLATGLAIGGALAAPYYYGPPAAYYDAPPAAYYGAPVGGGNAVAYCMQRFRSYDPSTGTYLGNDGYRHPCP
jgi:BA14K-like protein